jgi:hypothetical protein
MERRYSRRSKISTSWRRLVISGSKPKSVHRLSTPTSKGSSKRARRADAREIAHCHLLTVLPGVRPSATHWQPAPPGVASTITKSSGLGRRSICPVQQSVLGSGKFSPVRPTKMSNFVFVTSIPTYDSVSPSSSHLLGPAIRDAAPSQSLGLSTSDGAATRAGLPLHQLFFCTKSSTDSVAEKDFRSVARHSKWSFSASIRATIANNKGFFDFRVRLGAFRTVGAEAILELSPADWQAPVDGRPRGGGACVCRFRPPELPPVDRDITFFLWLLKLGSLINLYFLLKAQALASSGAAAEIVLPAQIFFAVSAYRCLFPVRYEHNVVFHDSVLSSVFVTRLLATFSEVAYISLLSYVLRLLNIDQVKWVTALSWLMVALVVISQGFVWAAILTRQLGLFFWEELGWALIFVANTVASAYLYIALNAIRDKDMLLKVNLLFGIVYLPWQALHLQSLLANARRSPANTETRFTSIWSRLATGVKEAALVKTRRTGADSWGGLIGLTWMTAYWATLIPIWVYYIVVVLASAQATY